MKIRIKTEEELVREQGKDWRANGPTWADEMDSLFGTITELTHYDERITATDTVLDRNGVEWYLDKRWYYIILDAQQKKGSILEQFLK